MASPDKFTHISEFHVKIRTYNILRLAGVQYCGDLQKFSARDFLGMPNCGHVTIREIRALSRLTNCFLKGDDLYRVAVDEVEEANLSKKHAGDLKYISVCVDQKTHSSLRGISEHTGQPLGSHIRRALLDYLKKFSQVKEPSGQR